MIKTHTHTLLRDFTSFSSCWFKNQFKCCLFGIFFVQTLCRTTAQVKDPLSVFVRNSTVMRVQLCCCSPGTVVKEKSTLNSNCFMTFPFVISPTVENRRVRKWERNRVKFRVKSLLKLYKAEDRVGTHLFDKQLLLRKDGDGGDTIPDALKIVSTRFLFLQLWMTHHFPQVITNVHLTLSSTVSCLGSNYL